MGDAAVPINHDVTVVPIFDLNDVAQERIGRHGLNKVDSSLLEVHSIRAAVLHDEKAAKIVDFRAAHFVSRCSVRDDINHAALVEVKAIETYSRK